VQLLVPGFSHYHANLQKRIYEWIHLIFISAMRELDLLVLLMTPSTSTLMAMTYSYLESGFHQFSDAVTALIVVIIIIVYFLAVKLGNVDMSEGLGG